MLLHRAGLIERLAFRRAQKQQLRKHAQHWMEIACSVYGTWGGNWSRRREKQEGACQTNMTNRIATNLLNLVAKSQVRAAF